MRADGGCVHGGDRNIIMEQSQNPEIRFRSCSTRQQHAGYSPLEQPGTQQDATRVAQMIGVVAAVVPERQALIEEKNRALWHCCVMCTDDAENKQSTHHAAIHR